MSEADSQTKRLMGSKKEELAEGFEVGSLFLFSQSEWFQAMRIYMKTFSYLTTPFSYMDKVCFSLVMKSVYHWQIHLLLLGRRWDQSAPTSLWLKLGCSNWDPAWCWEDIGEETWNLWKQERKEEKSNRKYRDHPALQPHSHDSSCRKWRKKVLLIPVLVKSRNKTKQNNSSGISC